MFDIPTIHLVLLIAATWRLSNILANKEEGPFQMFWWPHLWARRMSRKHTWFKKSKIIEGMECEYCCSIWFGTALALGYLFLGDVLLWLILPLALSTGTIIIKHVVFLIKSIDTRYDQQNQNELTRRTEDAALDRKIKEYRKEHEQSGLRWDSLPNFFEQERS